MIDAPEIRPSMNESKICKYMVLWGNEQSEELKKSQYEMIETWN